MEVIVQLREDYYEGHFLPLPFYKAYQSIYNPTQYLLLVHDGWELEEESHPWNGRKVWSVPKSMCKALSASLSDVYSGAF